MKTTALIQSGFSWSMGKYSYTNCGKFRYASYQGITIDGVKVNFGCN